ncbi:MULTISPECIES: MaoC family dehydratase [unclassified Streptomyces]|uniref:MaoC family dehydratase n=1 Tax=unclassified Streptomyces TaxID=2593676 RepID=UPI003D8AAA14
MLIIHGTEELRTLTGHELGVSEWTTIEQEDVNTFANLTGDHQWIHIDIERARGSRFGGTIAHGYLTLGLVPRLASSIYRVQGFGYGLNYGVNKVRFPSPLPVGSRIRLRARLAEVREVTHDGIQVIIVATFECEGAPEKPVCVAETIVRYYP